MGVGRPNFRSPKLMASVISFDPSSLLPLVDVNPDNATYSGSNLSTIANAGTVGGSFSITGTISKTTSGSLNLLNFDSASKRLNLTFGVASGTLTVLYAGKLNAVGPGGQGIIGKGWPGGLNSVALYANAGSNDCFLFGNGCCSVDASHAPSFQSVAGGLADTGFHTMVGTVGPTNALYEDAVLQAITGGGNASEVASFPNPGTASWDFGVADASSETLNGQIARLMILDYQPTAQQVTDFHTYFASGA